MLLYSGSRVEKTVKGVPMDGVDTMETGVPGLDEILAGGLARGSLVLITGPTGAGKTILGTQVLFHQARRGRRALILTLLTEASTKLITHLGSMEYFEPALVGDGVSVLNVQRMLQERGLEAAIGEILSTVMEREVEYLLVESVHSLYALIEDESAVQDFLFRLGSAMFQVGCTALMVTDREPADGGESSLEAVISDVTVQLQVSAVGKRELRELRVVKARGSAPITGWHAYDITNAGIRVYPRIEARAVAVATPGAEGRLGWGVAAMDALTGGGIPRYDSTLVMGTAGMGKSTLGLHFVAEGVARGEGCLYVTFNETQDRLLGKAERLGMGLRAAVGAGTLHVAHIPPAALDLDSVLNRTLDEVARHDIGRVVLDTLNPLERVSIREGRFPEVLAALLNVLQGRGATAMILREMTQLVGGDLDLGDAHEAYWTPFDNIVLLRPVELSGRVGRVLSVFKMRQSEHDDGFYGYGIGAGGLEIGDALEGLTGLLTGLPRGGGS